MSFRPACLLAAIIVAATACSGGSSGTPTTAPATTTSIPPVKPDDGVLVLGALVPRGGSGGELGPSLITGITLAQSEIDAAGGVNGREVQVVAGDEGDNAAATELAVQELLDAGVDAIVGPTSSLNTLGALQSIVDAGVIACSPTASALALDGFPDRGLFFRTIPSDSLQAVAIAAVVEESGSNAVVVVHLDDDYGRPFALAVERALATSGPTASAIVGVATGAASIAEGAARVVAQQPDVVVVIADSTAGPAIIDAIEAANTGVAPAYVVNDALRRPDESTRPFEPAVLPRITGVSPAAFSGSATFNDALRAIDPNTTTLYAHEAYDCVNTIALAAEAAGSTSARDIVPRMVGVTSVGTSCASFAMCSTALAAGRNIDYDGPTGVLAFGSNGDVTATTFVRFGYDAAGRDIALARFTIGTD